MMKPPYRIALIVGITWLGAEVLKLFIEMLKTRSFQTRKLLEYGGMPSSHATLVTALCSSIFIVEGFTVSFIISLALSLLVVRDLITIRHRVDHALQETTHLSKLLNKSVDQPALLSHSPLQIVVGILLGIIVPFLLSFAIE